MGKTTLTVQEDTLERFNEEKSHLPGTRSADTFMNQLLDAWQEDNSWLPEQNERVDVSLDFPTADVKEAMRTVLREELPDGALRG